VLGKRAELVPPAADALDGGHRGAVADAEIDPSGIVGDVVDAIGQRLAEFGDFKIMHRNRLALPPGAQLTTAIPSWCRPEIAGSPAAWNAFTSALMCSNWVLRSGWLAPSGFLLLAYRLKAGRRSKRPTSF
jgi:hypothetical protein